MYICIYIKIEIYIIITTEFTISSFKCLQSSAKHECSVESNSNTDGV